MKYIVFLIVLIFSLSVFGQKEGDKLLQFSGVVVSADSLDYIPYVSIIDKTTGTGTSADANGYFNLVSKPGDTLIFRAFGFNPNTYIIPDTLEVAQYSIIHLMTPKTIELPEVKIYPWPTREEFADAFLEMDPYDGKIRELREELSGESLAELSRNLPPDYLQSYNYQREQKMTKIYIGTGGGRTPVNNLFNPNSWVQFVDAWRSGKLGRE